jgi:hypothetical protein
MVKHGLEHTWDGFKLLATNTRVTWGILKKMRRGEVLSRREQSLLMLTTADLVRIVCCAFLRCSRVFWISVYPKLGTGSLLRNRRGQSVVWIEDAQNVPALPQQPFLGSCVTVPYPHCQIPFSFFIIVPGAELLLPVAIKIFPGYASRAGGQNSTRCFSSACGQSTFHLTVLMADYYARGCLRASRHSVALLGHY